MPDQIENNRGLTLISIVIFVLLILSSGVGLQLVSQRQRISASSRVVLSVRKLALTKFVMVGKDCSKTVASNPPVCTAGALVNIGKIGPGTTPLISNTGTTKVGSYFLRATCEGTTQKKYFIETREENSATWSRIFPTEVFAC